MALSAERTKGYMYILSRAGSSFGARVPSSQILKLDEYFPDSRDLWLSR
jgi:hypothetical protein